MIHQPNLVHGMRKILSEALALIDDANANENRFGIIAKALKDPAGISAIAEQCDGQTSFTGALTAEFEHCGVHGVLGMTAASLIRCARQFALSGANCARPKDTKRALSVLRAYCEAAVLMLTIPVPPNQFDWSDENDEILRGVYEAAIVHVDLYFDWELKDDFKSHIMPVMKICRVCANLFEWVEGDDPEIAEGVAA